MADLKLRWFEFESGLPGPHLLILGGMHGNEPCGPIAITTIKQELEAGYLKLLRGHLTIVPICNPAAYACSVRFVDHNLNRIIGANGIPAAIAEAAYAKEIAALISESDIVLDLHSYSSGEKPFLFLDYDDDSSVAFAKALGIPSWVMGWPELYQTAGAALSQGDTATYAHGMGKTAIVVECGTHADPTAPVVAASCIHRALAYLEMVPNSAEIEPVTTPAVYKVTKVIIRDREGTFKKDWQHLDRISVGEDLIIFEDGSALTSPIDGVVMLPDKNAALWHEWLYIGQAIPMP